MNDTSNRLEAGEYGQRTGRRSLAKLWIGAGIAVAILGIAWLTYSYRHGDAAAHADATALPQVTVSNPLVRELDARLGFLGQFSAVERVELRAQVGGT